MTNRSNINLNRMAKRPPPIASKSPLAATMGGRAALISNILLALANVRLIHIHQYCRKGPIVQIKVAFEKSKYLSRHIRP